MTTREELKYKYNNLNVFGKIIVINSILFFTLFILKRIFKLGFIESYLVLPSDFGSFIVKPWTLITYGFLHADILHLVFNMLFLYYLSRVLLNLFRTKMVLNIYFLGIISGGILFLSITNLWPTNFFRAYGVLIGASAGVSSLLAFVGTYMADSEIRLFNVFTVKWKYIFFTFLGIDIFRLLLGLNQGGYIAHVGGYLLGFYYAKKLLDGKDIGLGFEKLMDSFVSLFKPKQTSNLKTVHRKKTKSTSKKNTKNNTAALNNQAQIDTILDKISKSGYDSLTAQEKAFLFKQGK